MINFLIWIPKIVLVKLILCAIFLSYRKLFLTNSINTHGNLEIPVNIYTLPAKNRTHKNLRRYGARTRGSLLIEASNIGPQPVLALPVSPLTVADSILCLLDQVCFVDRVWAACGLVPACIGLGLRPLLVNQYNFDKKKDCVGGA